MVLIRRLRVVPGRACCTFLKLIVIPVVRLSSPGMKETLSMDCCFDSKPEIDLLSDLNVKRNLITPFETAHIKWCVTFPSTSYTIWLFWSIRTPDWGLERWALASGDRAQWDKPVPRSFLTVWRSRILLADISKHWQSKSSISRGSCILLIKLNRSAKGSALRTYSPNESRAKWIGKDVLRRCSGSTNSSGLLPSKTTGCKTLISAGSWDRSGLSPVAISWRLPWLLLSCSGDTLRPKGKLFSGSGSQEKSKYKSGASFDAWPSGNELRKLGSSKPETSVLGWVAIWSSKVSSKMIFGCCKVSP